MVQILRDAHAGGATGETQEEGHMQEGDIDSLTTEIHGDVIEVGLNRVQIVMEGGRIPGRYIGTV